MDRNTLYFPRLALDLIPKNGFRPRLQRDYSLMRINGWLSDESAVNTKASKGSLFFVPLLREPLGLRHGGKLALQSGYPAVFIFKPVRRNTV
jgi:hypothetical protein